MGQILSIIFRWLWGEGDDKKKPSEKQPLISPPRVGSYGNSSSSRPALQPNLITSPQSLRSCGDYTLPTNLQTHPLPPLSSSSSAFSHSKISGTSRFQPTPQTHHQPNLSSCGLSSTTAPSPVHPKLETRHQLSSSSCSLSRPSGTSHVQPKIQTHPSLLSSSCSHSSLSGPSHFQPKPVTVPLSSVPSSNSGINGALQRNTPSFPLSLDLCSNSRSDDASDLSIPPKLKIKVVGDEKQVSALLQQYNRIEQKEERTRGVVGKNWWDCICEEEEVVSRAVFKERSIYNYNSCEEEDLEKGKLSRLLVKERWIKHYSSEHKILLVGEGDFSFSASLAVAFASASNITATSLDSIEFLSTNYRRALSNIHNLRSLGAKVMHDVDATKMANVFPFKCMRFDRVVYNFPLAGFFPDDSREVGIWRHQMLVQLFLENAKKMIHIDGEIHITHKSNGFFLEWNLELLASKVGLRLIEEVPFNFRDYPEYQTKYGFGGDKNFNCNPSKTYKFGHKKNGLRGLATDL